jgi:hypothetical protein
MVSLNQIIKSVIDIYKKEISLIKENWRWGFDFEGSLIVNQVYDRKKNIPRFYRIAFAFWCLPYFSILSYFLSIFKTNGIGNDFILLSSLLLGIPLIPWAIIRYHYESKYS